jgi:hypothetical protein
MPNRYASGRWCSAPLRPQICRFGVLLSLAGRSEPPDVQLAQLTYLDALSSAFFAGSSAGGSGSSKCRRLCWRRPGSLHRPGLLDLLLDGVATQATDGYAASVSMLKQALTAVGVAVIYFSPRHS